MTVEEKWLALPVNLPVTIGMSKWAEVEQPITPEMIKNCMYALLDRALDQKLRELGIDPAVMPGQA